jgi:hypothetical protein
MTLGLGLFFDGNCFHKHVFNGNCFHCFCSVSGMGSVLALLALFVVQARTSRDVIRGRK